MRSTTRRPGRGQRERPERDRPETVLTDSTGPVGIDVPRDLRDAKSLHGL